MLFCATCGSPQSRREGAVGVGVCPNCLNAVQTDKPTDLFAHKVSDLALPTDVLVQVQKARMAYRRA